MDINKVVMIGRLTKDPVLKSIGGDVSVCSFSIANNRQYEKNGEKKGLTGFFNCSAWNKLGEVIAEYCKKGDRVAVDGTLQQRYWDDKEGKKRSSVDIVVNEIQFLTDRRKDEKSDGKNEENNDSPMFSDDDIPF